LGQVVTVAVPLCSSRRGSVHRDAALFIETRRLRAKRPDADRVPRSCLRRGAQGPRLRVPEDSSTDADLISAVHRTQRLGRGRGRIPLGNLAPRRSGQKHGRSLHRGRRETQRGAITLHGEIVGP
jgi:hypothetical protein